MKTIRLLILLAALLSLIIGYAGRALLPGKKVDEAIYLKELAPGAVFSAKQGSPPHYRTGNGTVAFNTYDVVPSIRGYAGPVKTLIALDREGRILGLKILDHRETKNYIHYMETPGYLSRFIGKMAGDAFEVDKDIDGITRATVSVEALAKTVKESSRTVAKNVLGLEIREEEKGPRGNAKWISYVLLFSFALTSYFMTRKSRKLLRLRDMSLLAGLLVTGLYLSSPFSILQVFNLVLFRPSSSFLWYVIVGSTLISVFASGRFYCGWLCPFGALSEFIGRLRVRKWVIPVETDDAWRRLKYALLAAASVIVLVSGRVDYGNYETYITAFSFHGNVLAWILVVVTLLANLRVERFWCRYLCPVAAFTGILTRETQGYPSGKDCPMANKPAPLISECIRCNRCYRGERSSGHR